MTMILQSKLILDLNFEIDPIYIINQLIKENYHY